MVGCLKSLHNSIDELLLSAMTLCRYCLPADQHAIKARCQVVYLFWNVLLIQLLYTVMETHGVPLLEKKPSCLTTR